MEAGTAAIESVAAVPADPLDARPLPELLRAAIIGGWRGLSVSECAPGAPVRLVCAAEAARLRALVDDGLSIVLPAPRSRGGGRRVAITVGQGRDLALTLDLAVPDARAAVESIGVFEALDLVWVRAEDAQPVRLDLVSLTSEASERLRAEAARGRVARGSRLARPARGGPSRAPAGLYWR